MSIFEKTGGALVGVAHDRSLELFFDRHEAITRFVSLINEDPAPRRDPERSLLLQPLPGRSI